MRKELTYGISGLIIGAVLTSVVYNTTYKNTLPAAQSMAHSLKNKTGDEFDKAFIIDMVKHHQDAIDMANLSKQQAKRTELKDMANEIISKQSVEIQTMKKWQTDWGYKDSTSTRSH